MEAIARLPLEFHDLLIKNPTTEKDTFKNFVVLQLIEKGYPNSKSIPFLREYIKRTCCSMWDIHEICEEQLNSIEGYGNMGSRNYDALNRLLKNFYEQPSGVVVDKLMSGLERLKDFIIDSEELKVDVVDFDKSVKNGYQAGEHDILQQEIRKLDGAIEHARIAIEKLNMVKEALVK